MAFKQTKEVLEQARKFHHRLSEFYEDLEEYTSKEHTKALLSYMSRHETYLEESLAEFENGVSRNVLDSYFQYGSEATRLTQISEFEIKPEMDVTDVMTTAIHFDACLIKFYREMTNHSTSGKVREVFENLLVMEEHEQLELSKTLLELGSL